MIYFEVSEDALKKIHKNLQTVQGNAFIVLKNAINQTARESRKLLIKRAQDSYAVKSGRFNKAMTIKNATVNNLTANIHAEGEPMELKDFKVLPSKVPSSYKSSKSTRAKVISSNPLKSLEYKGIKAFIVQFQSGHISVAQRRTKARLPVKKLFSTSIPKMIGDEKRVYGVLRPQIQSILNSKVQESIAKEIKRQNARTM